MNTFDQVPATEADLPVLIYLEQNYNFFLLWGVMEGGYCFFKNKLI